METGYDGFYHCTNKGIGSRFEDAKKIIEFLGKSDVTAEPISSAHFPLPAARARSEMSMNYKLELLRMDITRPWEEALKHYIDLNWK